MDSSDPCNVCDFDEGLVLSLVLKIPTYLVYVVYTASNKL